MNSKRLKEIAALVDKNDSVLDLGCDHGYLSIYLTKNKLCKNVIASDISNNAIEGAIKNFKKYKVNIKSYVCDGFNNINEYFDTVIIAGMGTNTIIDILNHENIPNKLIISSNNDLYLLRKYLNKIGYSLKKEIVVNEKNHYYVIMKYVKGLEKLKKKYLKFGINKNEEYLNKLIEKNNLLIKTVPFIKKIELYYDNYLIKKLLKELRSV